MQISSTNNPVLPLTATPTARQQNQLTQGNTADATASSVTPNTPGGVVAVGQSQAQNSTNDGTQQKKPDPLELQNSVKQLNDVAKLYSSQLEFSVDKETNIQVVKVVDQETHQVIRQIPTEDAIRIAKAIDDFKGLLLKDKA
ncbi:flagellar protein FlaG [Aquitalea sp. LB_tupeE]|uniref:flagellar protein FlaG n=1 Tax=Aquitalea sp. LB_tupeE TaxID=2748078 RepID=UPI0015BC26A3|nr:flagellar protein FlaG [Aquitalea sp. LB_tupeE]NWK77241.1 flagellar protein FlaG [Aquitalea sp. LB_tupeE]